MITDKIIFLFFYFCKITIKGMKKIMNVTARKEIKEYVKGYKTGLENKVLYSIKDEKIEKSNFYETLLLISKPINIC